MADLVVVGAGLGGQATALFCARRGHKVVVVERDPPPPRSVEDAFAYWQRIGVPQCRQGHLFLARSSKVLREEAPDVLDAILSQGAAEPSSTGHQTPGPILVRRLVYEALFRSAVEREPKIRILSRRSATGLRMAGRRNGLPVVNGAHCAGGEDFPADLVIDATGRACEGAQWLASLGARPLSESCHPCGFTYVSRHYRLRAGCTFPTLELPLVATLDYADVVIFPADGGIFSLSVVIASADRLRRRLMDGDAFDRFLQALPLTAPWIAAGQPIDRPHGMGGFLNRWRRLTDGSGPVVAGFVLIGDAGLGTSPTLGRGVSLAFAQAQQLARALESRTPTSAEFVADHESWAAQHLGIWFESQVAEDAARDSRLHSSVMKNTEPKKLEPVSRLIATLAILREQDAVVKAAADQVFNLLIEPAELLRNREVLRRINAHLNRHFGSMTDIRSEGPTRLEFERILVA